MTLRADRSKGTDPPNVGLPGWSDVSAAHGEKRSSIQKRRVPRPFIKWVGGKTQLLEPLISIIDSARPFGSYHEPFAGGAALFFELQRTGRLHGAADLSDINPNLMDCYYAVRDDCAQLIEMLQHHKSQHSRSYYYTMRSARPVSITERAARVIYLNKTCFNGLYRENSNGDFNVPIGDYTNPQICDADNLTACAAALQSTALRCAPFQEILSQAHTGDVVYFDPPYVPLSSSSSFTAYAKAGFGMSAQAELADVARELARKGIAVILSNSDTPIVRALYAGFRIHDVLATRAVNSSGTKRGKIGEVIATNLG